MWEPMANQKLNRLSLKSNFIVRNVCNVNSADHVKLAKIVRINGPKTSNSVQIAIRRERSISIARFANVSGLMILFKKLMKEL